MNQAKKILTLIFVSLISLTALSFAAGLNVLLNSQNPDPVAPGNFVYVNVQVSNVGDESIQDTRIELLENKYFSLATGSEKIQNLGVIPAYSSSSSNFIIAKFKVAVDEATPLGLNTLEFEVSSPNFGSSYTYDFDILVEDKKPSLEISKFDIPILKAGDSQPLTIEIKNTNSIELKDIEVKLLLDEVTSQALMLEQGSNEVSLYSLDAKSSKELTFQVVANPNVESQLYLVPLQISYSDALGNEYEKEVLGSVKVYSKPLVSLQLDAQESFETGTQKLSFALANPGTSSIKGTQFKILPSQDYTVLSGKTEYVGDLNPDDFQTVQSEVVISSDEIETILVELSYLDSYNQEQTQVFDLPIRIYSQEELVDLGLSSSSKDSSFPIGTSILVVLVGIIGYIIGKKRGAKKALKKNK